MGGGLWVGAGLRSGRRQWRGGRLRGTHTSTHHPPFGRTTAPPQEAKDREWRNKERAAAERRAATAADLAAAREAQLRARVQLQADAAAVERAEFDRVLAANRQKEAELAAIADAQRRLNAAHRGGLAAQVQAAAEAKARARAEWLEEGRALREAEARGKARLEEVRAGPSSSRWRALQMAGLLAARWALLHALKRTFNATTTQPPSQQVKAAKLAELAADAVPEKYRAQLARLKI